MALPKRHWGNAAQTPGFIPSAACGRDPASFERELIVTSPTSFDGSAAKNPDWYCKDCAKAARLALAAESAPKPLDAVWPKPRPISEAPIKRCILGWIPATDECKAGWELLHYSVSATEWRDNAGIAHEPTHFLPLPPEVK